MKKKKSIFNLQNNPNKKEIVIMIISAILILLGGIWCIKENIERDNNLYITGLTTRNMDSEGNVEVVYKYDFATQTSIITAPKYLKLQTNEEIPLLLNKSDYQTISYGNDTRIYSVVLVGFGVAIFIVQILVIQAQEQKRKLIKQKNIIRNGYNGKIGI